MNNTHYLLHFHIHIDTLCLSICTLSPWGLYYCAMTIISRLFSTARNPRVAGGEYEAKLDMRSAANLQLGFRN